MIDDRERTIVEQDLRRSWKAVAALVVPFLLLALAVGGSGVDEQPFRFAARPTEGLGDPQRADVAQDGDAVTATLEVADLPSTPPDGAVYGAFLRGIESDRQTVRWAVAFADNGSVQGRVVGVTDDGTQGWQAVADAVRPVESEDPSPNRRTEQATYTGGEDSYDLNTSVDRVDVYLEHETATPEQAPQGALDLQLQLSVNGTEETTVDDDPGQTGNETLDHDFPVEPLSAAVVVTGDPEKPDVDTDYTLTIVEHPPPPEPPEQTTLPGEPIPVRYDPDTGQVALTVPRDELFPGPGGSRQIVRYSGFLAADGGLVAGTATGGGGQAGVEQLTATRADAALLNGLSSQMAVTLTVAFPLLVVSAFVYYGRSLATGNIRVFLNYAVPYERLHVVKACSSLLPGLLGVGVFSATVLPVLVARLPLPLWQVPLFTLAIAFTSLVGIAIVAVWAVSLSAIATRWTGDQTFGFHRMFAATFGFAALTTESTATRILLFFQGGVATRGELASIQATARTIARVSPFHFAGRLLGTLAGAWQGLDVLVVAAITAGLVVAGGRVADGLHPDVLLTESAT